MPHCDFVENRSQGRMTALAPSLLAAGFYISGILYQLHCLGKRLAVNASLLRAIGLVALLAHAMRLWDTQTVQLLLHVMLDNVQNKN